jgi:hypothetical protein
MPNYYAEIVRYNHDHRQSRSCRHHVADSDQEAISYFRELASEMGGTVDYVSFTETIVVYQNPDSLK